MNLLVVGLEWHGAGAGASFDCSQGAGTQAGAFCSAEEPARNIFNMLLLEVP